jgi:hypothetical protein
VHELLTAMDSHWAAAAPLSPFGPRARWAETIRRLAADWPVLDDRRRWRLGEVTISWSAVAS